MTASMLIALAATSLIAATVNGALGYGYSSISVPIALLFLASRVLSPALVVVEVVLNLYALYWNRRAVRAVLPRVLPLIAGLVPGVVAGALLLDHLAPAPIKLAVYLVLLPLIVLQASGRRFPLRRERSAAVPLGGVVGLLYGLTTISGPPLALFWNNQGVAKDEFKVALAVVRSAESVFALLAYAWLGLLTWESSSLLPWIAPGVLIGFPIGHWLIHRVGHETFRRVCMSFDAYLVAFGLSRALSDFGVDPLIAYQALALTSIVDTILLWGFFRERGALSASIEVPV
jgi:hypothetical protein